MIRNPYYYRGIIIAYLTRALRKSVLKNGDTSIKEYNSENALTFLLKIGSEDEVQVSNLLPGTMGIYFSVVERHHLLKVYGSLL